MSDQKRKESTQETATQLTEEQRDQAQKVTDKLVPELKVATVEDRANPGLVMED